MCVPRIKERRVCARMCMQDWLIEAFEKTTAMREHGGVNMLSDAREARETVACLHDIVETLVLHTLDAPPGIFAFRRSYRGAARVSAPVRNRFGYATELILWKPGLQQHVNEYNTLVFTLKIFDASLVRLYVPEVPVSSAARLAVAAR